MKKTFLAILLLLTLTLSLFGCDGTSEVASTKEATDVPTIAPEATDAPVITPETIVIDTSLPEGTNKPVEEETLSPEEEFEKTVRSIPTAGGYTFAGWYSDKAYTDYIDPYRITASQYAKGTAYAKWIVPVPQQHTVRMSSVTITDSGRKNQQMDVVYINDAWTLTDLIHAGYQTLTVTVSLDVSEVNDGYQYVFLYKDTSCPATEPDGLLDAVDQFVNGSPDDTALLHPHKFEHTPGAKDTNWATETFTVQIPITKLEENLYIRYGASGSEEDDWLNKNVTVTLTPKK